MCCFSQAIRSVSSTQILARALPDGRELLVYSMRLDADGDLAMVLPIPTPVGSPEDAVKFVDFSACPTFFTELETLFPVELMRGMPFGAPAPAGLQPQAKLIVHDVGEFEASFVPTRDDFRRLDKRFRLSPDALAALPTDWGFAVFKLRNESHARSFADRIRTVFGAPPKPARTYHPMAFEFPRRDPSKLFLPTVHIHDGQIHERADFDHVLFVQGGAKPEGWRQSATAAGTLPFGAKEWLDPADYVYRRQIHGSQPNQDVFV